MKTTAAIGIPTAVFATITSDDLEGSNGDDIFCSNLCRRPATLEIPPPGLTAI
jgi:hypothetical protein